MNKYRRMNLAEKGIKKGAHPQMQPLQQTIMRVLFFSY